MFKFTDNEDCRYRISALSDEDACLCADDRIFAEALELKEGVKIQSVEIYKKVPYN